MIRNALLNFGLNEREVEVYLALLKEKDISAPSLANITKIHKSTVYLELENLIRKGLVNYVIKDSKKYFKPTNPSKFIDILDEKKANIQKVMPELESLIPDSNQPEFQVYEGKEGVKSLLLDVLKENKDIVVFGVSGKILNTLEFYLPQFIEKTIKSKITAKYLVNLGVKKKFEKLFPKTRIQIKSIPKRYESKVATIVYGDKVAIHSLEKSKIYVVLIKDKDLAESYKNTFNLMWDLLRN